MLMFLKDQLHCREYLSVFLAKVGIDGQGGQKKDSKESQGR